MNLGLTSIEVLVNSFQPSNIIMSVWNQVYIDHTIFNWVTALKIESFHTTTLPWKFFQVFNIYFTLSLPLKAYLFKFIIGIYIKMGNGEI